MTPNPKLVASYIQSALHGTTPDNPGHFLTQPQVEQWVELVRNDCGPMVALHNVVHGSPPNTDDNGLECYQSMIPSQYAQLWEMEFENSIPSEWMAAIIATVFMDTRPEYIRK